MKAPTTFWTQNQMIFLGSTPVQSPPPPPHTASVFCCGTINEGRKGFNQGVISYLVGGAGVCGLVERL